MNGQNSESPIPPPWMEYPDREPTWGGWRQGTSEAWLQGIWLPYWEPLTAEERTAYLQRWPPPDDEWRLYVTHVWK